MRTFVIVLVLAGCEADGVGTPRAADAGPVRTADAGDGGRADSLDGGASDASHGADAGSSDAGEPDEPTASEIRATVELVCGVIARCFPGTADPDCIEHATLDCSDCSRSELVALEACGEAACDRVASCTRDVACLDDMPR